MTISNHLLFHSLRETGALTFCLIPFTPTQNWRNVRLCYSNASFDFNFWCLVLWTTAFTNKINVRNLQHDMFGWKLRTKIPCCCNLRQKFRNEQTALILLQLSTWVDLDCIRVNQQIVLGRSPFLYTGISLIVASIHRNNSLKTSTDEIRQKFRR